MSKNTKTDRPYIMPPVSFESMRTLMESLPIGVALVTLDGTFVAANPKFLETYRYSGIEYRNETAEDRLVPVEERRYMNLFELVNAGYFDRMMPDPPAFFDKVFGKLRRGEAFTMINEVNGRVIELRDVPLGNNLVLTTQIDVTERVAAEREVKRLATHDSLTDLPNRSAFSQKVRDVLEEAKAKSERFAVVAVDLDRFKEVNDVFGHGAGDELLRHVARRFSDVAGEDFVSRLGGDEFVFISYGKAQPEAAAALAEALIGQVSGEVEIGTRRLMVALSAGIAVYPDNGTEIETLLNNADAALYRAKYDGRGTYRFFESEMDQRIHNRRVLAQDMSVALAAGELALQYQPQATVRGKVTGYEALLRWNHPRFGLIEAAHFVPIAEENGLIIEIGQWVLREACTAATRWDEKLSIAVNVSSIQIRHGDFAKTVHEVLFATGLEPERLEIEITESVLVHDFPRALSILRRIKALGVRVTMDDFGTGYSSLSYLQAFPFDKLKIDRSFVAHLETDPHAREIVRAVIGLGRGLNLPIVAEGVETDAQRSFLARERCFGIQGFLIGAPAPLLETGRPVEPVEVHAPRRKKA